MHTYQARWTCQCGATNVLQVRREDRLTASSLAVVNAVYAGQSHQLIRDCEEVGVRITDHKEVKK